MGRFRNMQEITHKDYLKFVKNRREVQIENTVVKLHRDWNIEAFGPPEGYISEKTTIWSFPDRGNWATHIGNYRGNWSPYVPRNLILKYTKEGDTVLDQMVGSGTTLVECKLLNRNGIGVDINKDAIMVTRDRLNFKADAPFKKANEAEIKTYVGDARNLDKIRDESIDLVAFHPPYVNIIGYSNSQVEGDLSSIRKVSEYLNEMKRVAEEAFRVLRPGKYCAVLIGETRRHKHYIPVAARLLQVFLEVGFLLKEDIIKLQWNTTTTRERWRGNNYDFYLIAHEHLFVFRKPLKAEKLASFNESMAWR